MEGKEEQTLFQLLDQLYALNHENWKRRILMLIVQKKQVSYGEIKGELLEVPELLVYKCIRELMKEEMIERKETECHKRRYGLLDEEKYINDVLKGKY